MSKLHILPRKSQTANIVRVGGSKYGMVRTRLEVGSGHVELTETEVDDLIVMLEYQRNVNNGTISG